MFQHLWEVDTGASVSIVSEELFKTLQEEGAVLHPSQAKLCTYTGEPIRTMGTTDVTVEHGGRNHTRVGALLGRDWLASLKLDWKRIFAVHAHKTLDEVLESHKEVFEDGLGTAAAIHVDPAAMPQFFKATILT